MNPNTIIITFANQKGGVGKSTLCNLFGCYLMEQGKRVLVLDGDSQRSIAHRRELQIKSGEIIEGPGKLPSFDLRTVDLNSSGELMETLNKIGEDKTKVYDVVLIDSPGSIKPLGLVELMTQAHYVVTPFNYEHAVLMSTFQFIQFFFKMNRATNMSPEHAKGRLILIPNHIDPKWGTKDERKLWEQTLVKLTTMAGDVTSSINDLKILSMWSTATMFPRQWEATEAAFSQMYHGIFHEEPPITHGYEYKAEKSKQNDSKN